MRRRGDAGRRVGNEMTNCPSDDIFAALMAFSGYACALVCPAALVIAVAVLTSRKRAE